MDAITISIITLIGTIISGAISALISNNLVKYRLEQLEKKVDKHNNLVERMYNLETEIAVIKEDWEMCPGRQREDG